jgi:cell division transport system permease protein
MSFTYTVRESIAGFRRARLSGALATLTIGIALSLLGLFVAVTVNADRLVDALRARLEMEAFLQEPLSDQEISALIATVSAVEGVERVDYVSKEEAAVIFKQDFGEDISSVLDFNPLPPSFKIILRPAYRTSAGALGIHDRLLTIKGIESVVYRKTLLDIIDQRAAAFNKIVLILGGLIGLSALFLTANTIRLAIHARRRIIRTMELVGATHLFIRLPYLIEGLVQGIVGGGIAAGLLYLGLDAGAHLVAPEFASFLTMPSVFYAGVALAGVVFGLVGSMISLARFVRPSAAR